MDGRLCWVVLVVVEVVVVSLDHRQALWPFSLSLSSLLSLWLDKRAEPRQKHP